MTTNSQLLPLRHLSIRVPWHDAGWTGTVCTAPRLNGACLRLKRIADNKNDDAEEAIAGKSMQDLDQNEWPPCIAERSTFMAPFAFTRVTTHPYSKTSPKTHGHFSPTPLTLPAYSAATVPFKWVLSENMEKLAAEYNLNVDPNREPELGFTPDWVQERDNQATLLNCFARHIRPQESLCFFYAKRVPFLEEDGRRVIIGVGRVTHIEDEPTEYQYSGPGELRSVLWERMVRHSIRPDFKDGFILPYHQGIKRAEEDPEFDPSILAAFAPEDRFEEFSYGSEHVTHDGAIASLLECARALTRAKEYLPGPWDQCLKWIDERLAELWKMRGPCPGLGAALSAFGVELGTMVARHIEADLGENEDPWPHVDQLFSDPKDHLPADLASKIGTVLQRKWLLLPDQRKALLKLLSRMEIKPDQATALYVPEERKKAGIQCTDKDIIENPYLIYELSRLCDIPVSVWTVDRGVFPDPSVRAKHPVPEPSAVEEPSDSRRIRAYTVHLLEAATASGHTLLYRHDLIVKLRELPVEPALQVDQDTLAVIQDDFKGVVDTIELHDDGRAYQLQRLSQMGRLIRDTVNTRLQRKRLLVEADWRALLDNYFKEPAGDEAEERARVEKAAALKEIAESPFSVLIGSAGTGKTTLLAVLCDQRDIAAGDVLLLAPTGKARVKIEQVSKDLKLTAYTIAQYLRARDRFDDRSQRYKLSQRPAEEHARTIIVDEASMVTEEMLAALMQSLKGYDRMILVGDAHQLPPIGPGRPFADIIKRLAPENIYNQLPKVGPGYAELGTVRRQGGHDREDLRLATWFSGAPIAAGEDDILSAMMKGESSDHIRIERWETPEELHNLLLRVVVDELKLKGPDDEAGFSLSLGATFSGKYAYFNSGAAEKAESWQVLTPLRGTPNGVFQLNRLVHQNFKKSVLGMARTGDIFLRPLGAEEVVYGDKVINTVNHRHHSVFPKEGASNYIANGEIGIVIGQIRGGRIKRPWELQVEFATQQKFRYSFRPKDFSDDAEANLELAYALTVHKSQGSEFGLVVLVIPNPCRPVSRELLYTALTRQTSKVVILHQGDFSELKKFTSDFHSETARRLTNLFDPPRLVDVSGSFFEESLINKTSKDEPVRSKSEVIIADRLADNNVEYTYEKPLTFAGVTRYPDFTIEHELTGDVFYWEHLGMMQNPSYVTRWKVKLEWYRENGIWPRDEGKGERGTLIITEDTEQGGISSAEIDHLVKEVLQK